MTRAETNFVDDDLVMARRALLLLDGHAPGDEPPADLDLDRLFDFAGSDGFATPLAHFALVRKLDAIRAAPAIPVVERTEETDPRIVEAVERMAARAGAAVEEKRANAQLREAVVRLNSAIDHWVAASGKRADDFRLVQSAVFTGEHQAVLSALLSAGEAAGTALDLMDRSMRQLPLPHVGNAFPSLLGLPKAERTLLLNAQAQRLHEAGHSLEEIAYVMGWDAGSPQQVRDRTRKRLEDVRAQEAAAEPKA